MDSCGAMSDRDSLYELLGKALDEVTPNDLRQLEEFKAEKYEDVW